MAVLETAEAMDVAERMKTLRAQKDPAERAEIEEASKILRKVRATLPLTVIQRSEHGA